MNAGCGMAIDAVFNVSPESLQDLPAYTNAVPVEGSVQLWIESQFFYCGDIHTCCFGRPISNLCSKY